MDFKIVQAAAILLVVFVGFAMVTSFLHKIFVAAEPSAVITGTIVLSDNHFMMENPGNYSGSDVVAPIALPGTTCSVTITACQHHNRLGANTQSPFFPYVKFNNQTAQGNAASWNPACTLISQSNVPAGIYTVAVSNTYGTSWQPGDPDQRPRAYLPITFVGIAYSCTA